MIQGLPPFVLMDINMPFLDSYDTTTQIRKGGNKVPIVSMTAYALKGDRELCLEKGMDDYISLIRLIRISRLECC